MRQVVVGMFSTLMGELERREKEEVDRLGDSRRSGVGKRGRRPAAEETEQQQQEEEAAEEQDTDKDTRREPCVHPCTHHSHCSFHVY